MTKRPIAGLFTWGFDDDDERASLRELESLSDRAAGIVAASILEIRLTSAIKSCLVIDDPAVFGELFRDGGALGSFDSKINLAYVLGIASNAALADLRHIKKIRNGFAHKLKNSSFEDEGTKARCFNLSLVDKLVIDYPGVSVETYRAAFANARYVDDPDFEKYRPTAADHANVEALIKEMQAVPPGGMALPGAKEWLTDARQRYFITILLFCSAFSSRRKPSAHAPFI